MTVVAVVARAPVPGACKSRLSRHMGKEPAASLYQAMLTDVLEQAARIGSDRHVLLAAPESDGVRRLRELAPVGWEVIAQRGEDLGQRLQNGFDDLRGSGPVVIMSSDSPTLSFDQVNDALHTMGDALLGPCDDGGYYLIGLRTREPRLLNDIPWSTPDVLAITRQRCVELGLEVTELSTWYDIDEAPDLERLCAELHHDPGRAPATAAFLRSRGLFEAPRSSQTSLPSLAPVCDGVSQPDP